MLGREDYLQSKKKIKNEGDLPCKTKAFVKDNTNMQYQNLLFLNLVLYILKEVSLLVNFRTDDKIEKLEKLIELELKID